VGSDSGHGSRAPECSGRSGRPKTEKVVAKRGITDPKGKTELIAETREAKTRELSWTELAEGMGQPIERKCGLVAQRGRTTGGYGSNPANRGVRTRHQGRLFLEEQGSWGMAGQGGYVSESEEWMRAVAWNRHGVMRCPQPSRRSSRARSASLSLPPASGSGRNGFKGTHGTATCKGTDSVPEACDLLLGDFAT
jgi:hypothetical protein